MNKHSVRSYEVLHRIARVKASQAALALAAASQAAQAASDELDQATSHCATASNARARCIRDDGSLSLGEYAMLSELHASLETQRGVAVNTWTEAKDEQVARGSVAASTQRFADGVQEELELRRQAVVVGHQGRILAESLDLWMLHREES